MAHKEKAIPGSLVWVWETLEVVRVWSESKPRGVGDGTLVAPLCLYAEFVVYFGV